MERALLFLDVDSTLLPFSGAGRQMDDNANPLLAGLDPEHGRRLAELPCDLVWATTWMAEANEVLAPRLGLPQLPIVDRPDDDDDDGRLRWKTRHLVEWAAGRSFVWVDDEITDVDRTWVAAHHSGPALLHRVNPGSAGLMLSWRAVSTASRAKAWPASNLCSRWEPRAGASTLAR